MAYLSRLSLADDATKATRDAALLDYLAAYDDYTTTHVELQAILRQGHIDLSRARRDLSRNAPLGSAALGPTLYPREIAPLLTLSHTDAETDAGTAPELTIELSDGSAADDAAAKAADDGGGGDGDDGVEEAEKAALAELASWGIGGDLQRQIAAAVTDRGDDVAMACGDALAIERRDGTVRGTTLGAGSHSVRSQMTFAAGGIDELKHAQFRAALGAADVGEARPKPQTKPSNSRDPLRWFAQLPPPSLRQAQRNFRRVTELSVGCANAQARMEAARARYESLLPEHQGSVEK